MRDVTVTSLNWAEYNLPEYMKPFLKLVAEDLWEKSQGDLSRWTLVFPNKRAGLFFNEYLAEIARRPVWTPEYITVNELFKAFSPLKVADKIETICRMYSSLKAMGGTHEGLDTFYGWGERLLADFDDVDKHLADAGKIFSNLADIKAIEGVDYLDNEQKQIIKDFSSNFSKTETSEVKEKFLGLWDNLYSLYQQLNGELKERGEAYEGAMFRDVVENRLEEENFTRVVGDKMYAIIGFNVIDNVEQRLFDTLKEHGQAVFYWDYDVAYTSGRIGREAGKFLNYNLKRYGNELLESFFSNLEDESKEIEFVSASTETAQAKYATQWLRDHVGKDGKRTAVVLCNESLLHAVVHALPQEVGNANVTKGYPLHHTRAFSLLAASPAADDTRTPLEYVDQLIEAVKHQALSIKDKEEANGSPEGNVLLTEAYFSIFTILNRVRELIKVEANDDAPLEVESLGFLNRLIKQIARTTTIPFHGEPAIGVQIMGVLETRCLDFDNLLLLSVNEGNIPQKAANASFIPYCLRKAFDLSLPERKTNVYAYYFYRLISRAKHVTMTYNCTAEGLAKGEMSRFMTQLMVESKLSIKHSAMVFEQNPMPISPKPITKPQGLDKLIRHFSPSSINTYLRCQVMFYFQYVLRLNRPDKQDGVIPANVFGTIFHKSAQSFYQELKKECGGIILPDMLKPYLDKDDSVSGLRNCVESAYKEEIDKGEVNGINDIVVEVVLKYLRRLIKMDYDMSLKSPFKIRGLEEKTERMIKAKLPNGQEIEMKLTGSIDRRDEVMYEGEKKVRIVDYKTGGKPETARDVEHLFTPSKSHPHYIMQTFLYSLTVFDNDQLILSGGERLPVIPSLIFIHKAGEVEGKEYSPYIKIGVRKEAKYVTDFGKEYSEEFSSRLSELLGQILDEATPFEPTKVEDFCKTCKFRDLCYL